jgi:predicted RNA-binding protein with RPS1 domain
MIDRKTVHLTCKKSMLDEAVVAYCYPSQLKKHLALKGTVVLIEKGGVVVSFFGELSGYIPKNSLLKKGVTDISRYFYIGQVIDCTVYDIHESGKVTLSLSSSDSTEEKSHVVQPVTTVGSIVECKVEKVFNAGEGGSSGLEVFDFAPIHTITFKSCLISQRLLDLSLWNICRIFLSTQLNCCIVIVQAKSSKRPSYGCIQNSKRY